MPVPRPGAEKGEGFLEEDTRKQGSVWREGARKIALLCLAQTVSHSLQARALLNILVVWRVHEATGDAKVAVDTCVPDARVRRGRVGNIRQTAVPHVPSQGSVVVCVLVCAVCDEEANDVGVAAHWRASACMPAPSLGYSSPRPRVYKVHSPT